jgi:hypothetical protein
LLPVILRFAVQEVLASSPNGILYLHDLAKVRQLTAAAAAAAAATASAVTGRLQSAAARKQA